MHIPVLLEETISILTPSHGEMILDCTFGGGGHTSALLDRCECHVLGIDRDPAAQSRANEIKKKYNDRFDFKSMRFSQISELSQKFDGVLFDFGVSSFQLDEAERGFSFSKDAKLDMRMSSDGISAYDVVNSFSEEDLANIIQTYGDEPKAKKIAAEIVQARKISKIESTGQLAEIIRKAIGIQFYIKKHSKIDSATKAFQAIRIFVNDELNEINTALNSIFPILNNGARIALISFHALEDRIVKNWAKSRKNSLAPINKDIIKASESEISQNPRSRSAILRGFVYTEIGGADIKCKGNYE